MDQKITLRQRPFLWGFAEAYHYIDSLMSIIVVSDLRHRVEKAMWKQGRYECQEKMTVNKL